MCTCVHVHVCVCVESGEFGESDVPLYMEAGERRDPEAWAGGLDMDMGR